MSFKRYYRKNLPHFQPLGACFFVTFRLKNSLSVSLVRKLRAKYHLDKYDTGSGENDRERAQRHQRFFKEYDHFLDTDTSGPHYLKDKEVAMIVMNEIKKHDGDLYELLACVIMSNHVHMLIDTGIQLQQEPEHFDKELRNYKPLQTIMKRIKGATAYYANQLLERTGAFWQPESYDRFIRDHNELSNIVDYILNNPVKAGIVEKWEDFLHIYLKTYDPDSYS